MSIAARPAQLTMSGMDNDLAFDLESLVADVFTLAEQTAGVQTLTGASPEPELAAQDGYFQNWKRSYP